MGVFLDIGEYDFYGRFDFSDDSDFLPTILAEEFSQEEIPKYFAKFNESEPSISSEKPDFFRETESVLSAGSPAGIAGVSVQTVKRAFKKAKQINSDLPKRWEGDVNKTQRVVNAILAKGTITYLIN